MLGRPGAGSSSSRNGPLPADTHLLLGGIITGSHGAKIGRVLAVKIPGVKIDGGHTFRKQRNGGEGSKALMEMTRLLARILFAVLIVVNATRLLGTSDLTLNGCLNLSRCLPDRCTGGSL